MAELEHDLRALGAAIAFPSEPDLARAVRARLAARPARRRLLLRPRAVAVALALGLVALGIAFAVPPARTAILRFFGVGAVKVERVETLPSAPTRPLAAGFGPAIGADEATLRAGFEFRLPPGVRAERRFARRGIQVALVRIQGKTLLLAEIRGHQATMAKKVAGPGTRLEFFQFDGMNALWISGGPHVLAWEDASGGHVLPTRMAGNVLAWERDELTLRLEGPLTRAEAVAIARSIG